MRIMTVCTGNICRSPLGEYLLRVAALERGAELEVASSGISDEERGNPIDRRTKLILDELGIDSGSHRAKQFQPADFAHYDLILAMDLPHYHALKCMAKTADDSAKVRLMREFDPQVAAEPFENLGIYDPWYGDWEDFQITYRMIRDAVPGVIAHVLDQGAASAA